MSTLKKFAARAKTHHTKMIGVEESFAWLIDGHERTGQPGFITCQLQTGEVLLMACGKHEQLARILAELDAICEIYQKIDWRE